MVDFAEIWLMDTLILGLVCFGPCILFVAVLVWVMTRPRSAVSTIGKETVGTQPPTALGTGVDEGQPLATPLDRNEGLVPAAEGSGASDIDDSTGSGVLPIPAKLTLMGVVKKLIYAWDPESKEKNTWGTTGLKLLGLWGVTAIVGLAWYSVKGCVSQIDGPKATTCAEAKKESEAAAMEYGIMRAAPESFAKNDYLLIRQAAKRMVRTHENCISLCGNEECGPGPTSSDAFPYHPAEDAGGGCGQ